MDNQQQQQYIASAIAGTLNPQALWAFKELQKMREIDSERNHQRKELRKLEAGKQQRYSKPKTDRPADFWSRHPKPKGFG